MSRRQKRQRRPGGVASGNANASAGKRDYTTSDIPELLARYMALPEDNFYVDRDFGFMLVSPVALFLAQQLAVLGVPPERKV